MSQTNFAGQSARTTTTSQTEDLTQQHITTLQQLDQEYSDLEKVEKSLETYIQELQKEEQILQIALDQSSTSLKEQREREKVKNEEEAVARLEGVLMGGDSSSSDNEDEKI